MENSSAFLSKAGNEIVVPLRTISRKSRKVSTRVNRDVAKVQDVPCNVNYLKDVNKAERVIA